MGQSHVLISFHICSLLDDHVFVRPLLIINWIYLKLHLSFQIFVTTNCFLARCYKVLFYQILRLNVLKILTHFEAGVVLSLFLNFGRF